MYPVCNVCKQFTSLVYISWWIYHNALHQPTLNFGVSASAGTGIVISTLLAVDRLLNCPLAWNNVQYMMHSGGIHQIVNYDITDSCLCTLKTLLEWSDSNIKSQVITITISWLHLQNYSTTCLDEIFYSTVWMTFYDWLNPYQWLHLHTQHIITCVQ